MLMNRQMQARVIELAEAQSAREARWKHAVSAAIESQEALARAYGRALSRALRLPLQDRAPRWASYRPPEAFARLVTSSRNSTQEPPR